MVSTFVPETSGMSGAYHGDVPDADPLGPRSLCHAIDVTAPVVVPSNVMAAPVDV
jgi:hypothetical protein